MKSQETIKTAKTSNDQADPPRAQRSDTATEAQSSGWVQRFVSPHNPKVITKLKNEPSAFPRNRSKPPFRYRRLTEEESTHAILQGYNLI